MQTSLENCEQANSKSILTITTLQSDVQLLQEKILELESSLRTTHEQKTELELKCTNLTQRIQTLSTYLTINSETVANSENLDLVCAKFEELKTENLTNKKQLNGYKEKILFYESESKNFKERVEQLTSELRSLESEFLESRIQIANLKAERDAAFSAKQVIENDVQLLQSKLSETQRVWLDTQKELDTKEGKYTSAEMSMRKIEASNGVEARNFKAFRDTCAQLLTDDYFKCDSHEEDVKEKIKLLMVSSRHRGIVKEKFYFLILDYFINETLVISFRRAKTLTVG